MKARLPRAIFVAKAYQLYKLYLDSLEEKIPVDKQLKFSNTWIRGWMVEFEVSLLKPNKRYAIKYEDLVERVFEILANLLRIRVFSTHYFGTDPPIINGDQMPLHMNESSAMKTMSLKNQETFVKGDTLIV